jgi:hypothetical protein
MDLGKERAEALDRLLSDEDLLSLNDNIAVLDMRIIELVSSLVEGGNPAELWKQAIRSWDLMIKASEREDREAMAKHRDNLDMILRQGVEEIATWDEIDKRSETRRKLVETETRRREKMRYLVLVEDTLRDYIAVGRIVKETILDVDISKEMKLLILKRVQSGLANFMQIAITEGTETTSD